MTTKNIKKILLNKNGDSFVADIEHVVRSVNDVNTDADGNVEFHDYLPLTGGNVTGNLTVQNKNVATEDFVNNLNIIRKNVRSNKQKHSK